MNIRPCSNMFKSYERQTILTDFPFCFENINFPISTFQHNTLPSFKTIFYFDIAILEKKIDILFRSHLSFHPSVHQDIRLSVSF